MRPEHVAVSHSQAVIEDDPHQPGIPILRNQLLGLKPRPWIRQSAAFCVDGVGMVTVRQYFRRQFAATRLMVSRIYRRHVVLINRVLDAGACTISSVAVVLPEPTSLKRMGTAQYSSFRVQYRDSSAQSVSYEPQRMLTKSAAKTCAWLQLGRIRHRATSWKTIRSIRYDVSLSPLADLDQSPWFRQN